jgi:hypothetical protein
MLRSEGYPVLIRVDAMRVSGVPYCGACQHEHLTSEYQFVPLQL